MKIVCAPQKVGTGLETNLRTLRRMRARVIGLTEMDLGKRDYAALVRRIFGRRYQVLVKHIGAHSAEIPVIVRTGLFTKVESFELLPISPNVGVKGTGNDRYLAVVRLRHFGRTYVVLHTHVDAVIQDQHSGEMKHNDRVAPTAEAMQTIAAQARAALADKAVAGVFTMGDFNYLPVGSNTEFPRVTPWAFAPQAIFRSMGMDWENSRVVYLAWSKRTVEARGEITEVPPHSRTNLADHGWLVGHFGKRRA